MTNRGHTRERQVRKLLEGQGWVVVRAAGSLGSIDLVALKADRTPRLIEVKSTAGSPYERFGPAERLRLLFIAEIAGAKAELAWWPKDGVLQMIPSSMWPSAKEDE